MKEATNYHYYTNAWSLHATSVGFLWLSNLEIVHLLVINLVLFQSNSVDISYVISLIIFSNENLDFSLLLEFSSVTLSKFCQ